MPKQDTSDLRGKGGYNEIFLNVNFQTCVWTDIVYLIVFSSCYDDRRDVSVFPLSVRKSSINVIDEQ